MPQTNLKTEILPQESRTELSGTEFLKKLQKKKEASKKDWNRNVFTVRTNDDISSMIKEDVSLGTFGSPEDIAKLVTYLASPVSKFATGAIWTLDGGQVR